MEQRPPLTPPPWRLRQLFESTDWLWPLYRYVPPEDWPPPETWPVPPRHQKKK